MYSNVLPWCISERTNLEGEIYGGLTGSVHGQPALPFQAVVRETILLEVYDRATLPTVGCQKAERDRRGEGKEI